MLGVTKSHINEFKLHLEGKNPFLVLKIKSATMAGKVLDLIGDVTTTTFLKQSNF